MMPKSWPWRNVWPISWGNKMTVCISAVCSGTNVRAANHAIVMASDQMISMGGYTGGDKVALKLDPLYYHWFSQFAANNVSAVLPIYEYVKQDGRESNTPRDSITDIAGMCKRAYKAARMERIQDEILAEYGITWKEFKEHGSTRLDQRDFQVLTERIRGFDLEVEMLLGGFDKQNAPHIFTVGNPGTVSYYDKLGFWAIGTGQPNALASLFASGYKPLMSLEESIAHVLSAKFSAESAQGVGKSTFLLVYDNKDQMHFLPDSVEAKIKREWAKLPRIPRKSIPAIKEALREARSVVRQSDAQTSEDQR